MTDVQIITGDALAAVASLPTASIQCCVTSPPYWSLRDYGHPGQIGLESTPEEYVSRLVHVFREVRRMLRPDGTLWLNLGDSYNAYNENRGASTSFQAASEAALPALPAGAGLTAKGLKPKDLIGIPWRVAFALQADGWFLRSDIIWHKPNPMPESVTDRPTKAHEYIFLLSKAARYYYDAQAIAERATNGERFHGDYAAPGAPRSFRNGRDGSRTETKNARTVWTIPPTSYSGAHFATFPPDLARRCILAGSRPGDTVLDPFAGSGTTAAVAIELDRAAVAIELNPAYVPLIEQRLSTAQPPLPFEAAE